MSSLETVRKIPVPEPTPVITLDFSPHKETYTFVAGEYVFEPEDSYYAYTNETITWTAEIDFGSIYRWAVGYHWFFGDGSEGNNNPATHIYLQPTVVQVSLVVTDNKGDEWTATQVLFLKEEP